MLSFILIPAAVLAASPANIEVVPDDRTMDRAELSAIALIEGRNADAIAELEANGAQTTDDPGQLINLGIAYARDGRHNDAEALFVAALLSPEQIELETADGMVTDSRRIARKALRMLDAGAFLPVRSNERLTLRD